MSLTVERLAIDGVLRLTPKRLTDPRGYFVETYSQRAVAEAGLDVTFVQDNQSLSRDRGTIRGLHFQQAPEPQAKLIRVIAGAVFDVAVDLRDGSPSYGQWCGTTLTADEGAQIFIPIGFAHAFCTLEPDTIVAYKTSGFYNKPAEAGVRWDDPEIGIEWPVPASQVTVSEKDANLPCLRDAATPFRF